MKKTKTPKKPKHPYINMHRLFASLVNALPFYSRMERVERWLVVQYTILKSAAVVVTDYVCVVVIC